MTKDQNNPKESSYKSKKSNKPTSSFVQVSDTLGHARKLQTFIGNSPNIFGAADIYNVRFQHPLKLAGMLTAILTGLIDNNGRRAVHKFVAIVPPELDAECCEEKIWSEIVTTFSLIAERKMAPSEQAWLKKRFQLLVSSDCRIGSVVDLINKQPEHTTIIVAEAANYRDYKIAPYIKIKASSPRPEDIWVPQLHFLASKAVSIAKKCKVYVALDANQFSPSRKVLSKLLFSIKDCGVMGSDNENSPDSILDVRLDQWDVWNREGRLGQIFRDIEQLPANLDSNKPYLRIQILNKAGLFSMALQALRQEIDLGHELSPSMRAKLAKIAQNANAFKFAEEILSPSIAELHSLEDLENALSTAQDAGLTELVNRISDRLNKLFPESSSLRQHILRTLLAKQDYAGAADIATEDSDSKAKFYGDLARFLSGDGIPDYKGLIALAERDISQTEAYRMACIDDALSRELIPQAFELAIMLPKNPIIAKRGEMLLLNVIKKIMLLNSKNGSLNLQSEGLQSAVISLIERLAANPENQELRSGLSHLIQPSVAGNMGLALIAFIVLNLSSRPSRLEKRRFLGKADMNWLLGRKPFLDLAFKCLESEGPIIIGKFLLSSSLLTEPADEVVSAIADYLTHTPLGSEDDVMDHWKWLVLGTSVSPHSSDSDYDLQLMRLVAGKFASSGRNQIARDLIEQTLLNCTATPRRRRLGWYAMADIYHRCHNNLEALIAMACAFASNDAVDDEQVWYEIIGLVRILRDSGLHEHAQSAIQKGRQILQQMGLLDAYSHRMDTLDLQIQQMKLQIKGFGKTDIENLLKDVARNGEAVLRHNDETEPTAIMLGQLFQQARKIGAVIPTEADSVYAELVKHARESYISLINMMTVDSPLADELLTLLTTSRLTRYSEDVGYDIHNAMILASRALSNDDYISDAINTSFALEILADRGVGLPDWDEAPEPPPLPQNIDEPARFASSISCEGVSVVQVGFNSSGRLVRVSTVDGKIEAPLREPDDLILEKRFKIWSKTYPYAYGIEEESVNLFYRTTADLRLSSLPQGSVVIIADVRFQPFPPNIIYLNDEFAGCTQAMAMAPSLSWLKAAHSKGMIGDGRCCSWTSTAVGTNESQTLSMIAERLEPTFRQYGFIVDNGPTLPAAFAGASIAVITAHGGIHPEGRYFQVVSDEGFLRVTARDLANALRNIGVVILFVCSGGRADKHPGAHTSLGLAKDILDRGCASVIASPWPLDSRVPSHWLPIFLEYWAQGDTLIMANFCANKEVYRYFSKDPARGLAMTIFGNPLIRRI